MYHEIWAYLYMYMCSSMCGYFLHAVHCCTHKLCYISNQFSKHLGSSFRIHARQPNTHVHALLYNRVHVYALVCTMHMWCIDVRVQSVATCKSQSNQWPCTQFACMYSWCFTSCTCVLACCRRGRESEGTQDQFSRHCQSGSQWRRVGPLQWVS